MSGTTEPTEVLLGVGDLVQFTILEAEHTRAASGAEKIELRLRVVNKEGAEAVMRERVMLDKHQRLGPFMRAINRTIGEFQDVPAWRGLCGFAILGYEEAKGTWPAKWRIALWGRGKGEITPVRMRQASGDPITRAEKTGEVVKAVAIAALSGKALPLQSIDRTRAQQDSGMAKRAAMTHWAINNGLEIPGPSEMSPEQVEREFDTRTGWAHQGARYHDGPTPAPRPAAIEGALVGLDSKDEVPF